ncbi:MAG: hypothetical protein M1821_002741 [Bathelium mastoideum]|nr:MAG: hypothetical protein M1821_002741 [Bathelium mastoideum]KAI9683764.1 MAG: hypothetical protein M1822_005954 [Bathelium mastoideum]
MSLTSQTEKASDPDWARRYTTTKDVPFYVENIDEKVGPDVRRLLEDYSKIPPEDVLPHVYEIRDKAWAIRSYPCTGIGMWLKTNLPKFPNYAQVLDILKAGGSLLDIGCFMGHDLRRIVFDGAPAEKIYATDIVNHWDLGYELFRDSDRFSAHFIEADILHPNERLQALTGTLDVVTIMCVIHQWEWDDQVLALTQIAKLLKPTPGSLAMGYQLGSIGQNYHPKGDLHKSAVYLHSPDTLSRMWNEVGEQTGSKWTCSSEFKTWEEMQWDAKDAMFLGPETKMLLWIAERVE